MPDPEDPKPAPQGDPAPAPKPAEGDGEKSLEEWKRHARHYESKATKLEDEARKGADAIKKLAELEDSQKTELQRLMESKDATEKELAAARQELLRNQVAHRHGLSLTQAKRLLGTTEEELEADAAELAEEFKRDEGDADKNLSRRPQERLRPGSTPNKEPEPDVKSIVDKVMAKSW